MKAIVTRYHGPGNRRGSRYSASDEDGNRLFISCDNALNADGNHQAAARALCEKMHWHGTLQSGGFGKAQVHVWENPDDKFTV